MVFYVEIFVHVLAGLAPALGFYCLRLRWQLKAERVSTEALRWALLRYKLVEAGMLPPREKAEEWPEVING